MKIIKKELKVTKYIVELDNEEATFLKFLTGQISGHDVKSYRSIADRIYEALGDDFDLNRLNHMRHRMEVNDKPWDCNSSIYFTEGIYSDE